MHRLEIEVRESPVFLTKHEGTFIKALISRYTGLTQTEFSIKIGMDKALLSRYLSGSLAIFDGQLKRIMDGIEYTDASTNPPTNYKYEAKWETRILIRPTRMQEHQSETGQLAPTVDSIEVDETSLS